MFMDDNNETDTQQLDLNRSSLAHQSSMMASVLPAIVPRSKSILDHIQECKRENNERLKQVKNLEDLVMFKLTTVADKLKEENEGNPVANTGIDMFQKLCDPLLAVHNNNYHQLPKKAYFVNKRKEQNSSVMVESTFSGGTKASVNDQRSFLLGEGAGYLSQFSMQNKKLSQDEGAERKHETATKMGSFIDQSGSTDLAIGSNEDPIKFLQQYFKKNGKKGHKVSHASYIMDLMDKKYGSSSTSKHNKVLKGEFASQFKSSPRAGLLLNQQSDMQSLSQIVNNQSTLIEQQQSKQQVGGVSFYSFSKEPAGKQPINMAEKSTPSQQQQHVESLNVLNFNKMKDELQKLFDLDNEAHTIVPQEKSYSPRGSKGDIIDMRNQRLIAEKEESYLRNVQFSSIVRSNERISPVHSNERVLHDPNPYSLPQINQTYGQQHSPNNQQKLLEVPSSTMKEADLISSHSHGKVTFGIRQAQNTNNDADGGNNRFLKNYDEVSEYGPGQNYTKYKEYFQDYLIPKPGPPSKDEKITMILKNSDPDAEVKLNYLSQIQEVKAQGFESFKHSMLEKRMEYVIKEGQIGQLLRDRIMAEQEDLKMAGETSFQQQSAFVQGGRRSVEPRLISQQSIYNNGSQLGNEEGQPSRQQLPRSLGRQLTYQKQQSPKWRLSQPIGQPMLLKEQSVPLPQHVILTREIESDIMRFNMNKNFERFQESLKLKKKALSSLEMQGGDAQQQFVKRKTLASNEMVVGGNSMNIQESLVLPNINYSKSNKKEPSPKNKVPFESYRGVVVVPGADQHIDQMLITGQSGFIRQQSVPRRNAGIKEFKSQKLTNCGGMQNQDYQELPSANGEDQQFNMDSLINQKHSQQREERLLSEDNYLSEYGEGENKGRRHSVENDQSMHQLMPGEHIYSARASSQMVVTTGDISPLPPIGHANNNISSSSQMNLQVVPQSSGGTSGKVSFINRQSNELKVRVKRSREPHPTNEINIEAPVEFSAQQRSYSNLQHRLDIPSGPNFNQDYLSDQEQSNYQQQRPTAGNRFFKKQQQKAPQQQSSASLLSSNGTPLDHIQNALDQQSYLMLEQFSDEIQNQLIDLAMSKRKAWSPKRFKKFPRFTIFLNNREESGQHLAAKEYLKEHIISLNPDFMNLLLNSNHQSGEQAAAQIEQALASINYPGGITAKTSDQKPMSASEEGGYRFQDPFDKVLLTKGIDNQILTSFRTLTKANNVVSDTLKIVHNKFSPMPLPSKVAMKMKQAYRQNLYVINEEVFNNTLTDDEQSRAKGIGNNDPKIAIRYEESFEEQNQDDSGANRIPIQQLSNEDLRSLNATDSYPPTSIRVESNMRPSPASSMLHISESKKAIVYQQQQQQFHTLNHLQSDKKTPSKHHGFDIVGTTDIINNEDQRTETYLGDTIDKNRTTPMGLTGTHQHLLEESKSPKESTQLLNPPQITSDPQITTKQQQKKQEAQPIKPDQKSTIVLQKIDPSEMFGLQRGGTTSLNRTQFNNNGLNDTSRGDYQMILADTYGSSYVRWPINHIYGSTNQQPINNSDYYQQPAEKPTPTIQQQISQHKQQMLAIEKTHHSKKKNQGFAGGFQTQNIPHNQPAQHLSENRYSTSAIQTLKQAIDNGNAQGKPSTLLNERQMSQPLSQSFIDSLSEQERQELTRKLIVPPQSKLKHLIDDLYQKEKKYVKQYLREDYIEKNNFIFDLQKSHALHTTKGIQRESLSTEQQQSQSFVGGLYTIGVTGPSITGIKMEGPQQNNNNIGTGAANNNGSQQHQSQQV